MTAETGAPLVIRFGAMGDMVLLTVLLGILHQRYGRPADVLTSGAWGKALLRGHPDAGTVHLLASRTRPYWSDPAQWALVRALRDRASGPIYVCDEHKQDRVLALLRRAQVDPAQILAYQATTAAAEPWVERWQRFGQQSPDAYSDVPMAFGLPDHPRLQVAADARHDLYSFCAERGLSGRLWLLQPGSKRTLKRGRLAALSDSKWWPAERWTLLAKHLLETDRAEHILVCGAPPEQPLLEQIASSADDSRVHALGDSLPIPRLLALCERAVALTSIDTGPAHAAVALGCPSVVLFGAADPVLWRLRGPPATHIITLRSPALQPKAADLSAKRVMAACDELRSRKS